MLTVEETGTEILVKTPFWTIIHDLHQGGAPKDIRFAHGLEGNVLQAPFGTYVDELSDLASTASKVQVHHHSRNLQLTFEGLMGNDKREASSIKFKTTYLYTPYAVRREVALQLPVGMTARRVSPLACTLDNRFTHWTAAHDPHTVPGKWEDIIGPHYYAAFEQIPSTLGTYFADSRPHGWISLFRTGGEGMQLIPTGDLSGWDAPAGKAGEGYFRLERKEKTIEIVLDALSRPSPAPLAAEMTFATSIGLTNLPPTPFVAPRTVMIGNPPFPNDEILAAWANSGVELIILMEGTRWEGRRKERTPTGEYWQSDTERFWRMGDVTPYHNEMDMEDLKRLVAASHRLGMKIIPYTGFAEIHPEVPGFAENIHQWRQEGVPNGGTMFHYTNNYSGAIYGAMVCPDSRKWQEFYLNLVETYIKEHDFDGIYIDLVSKYYCHNTRHGSSHHGGIDGAWKTLGSVRELLGKDKLIVAHNGDCNLLITLSNLADAVVTLESINGTDNLKWDHRQIAQYIRAFPSCPALLIPNYNWYNLKPPCPEEAFRDGLVKGLLLGSLPFFLRLYWEPERWGYANELEGINDPNGIFEAFRQLKSFDLNGLTFDDGLSGVVATNRTGVLGACYSNHDKQIIVLGNISEAPQEDIEWRCRGLKGHLEKLLVGDYRLIEQKTDFSNK
ncbi:MAG: DUF6259 domain-containing protein [Victivallales bacterium]